jgi:cytochrome c biogenesis protein CcmG/thiol:disulfide interchange protein DsbE
MCQYVSEPPLLSTSVETEMQRINASPAEGEEGCREAVFSYKFSRRMSCRLTKEYPLQRGKIQVSAEASRRFFLRMIAAAGVGLIIPGWLPRRVEAAFRVGDVPSRVILSDLKGNSFIIPSDLTGKVALIHFWASWCPTCRGEMKILDSFYVKYGGKGVTPCSIGIGEKRETAVSYLKNMTISYPILLDSGSSTRKPFGIAGIPTYFVLDRESVIRHRILGKADPEGLDRIVRSLL